MAEESQKKASSITSYLVWTALIMAVIVSIYIGALAADLTGAAIASALGIGAAGATKAVIG